MATLGVHSIQRACLDLDQSEVPYQMCFATLLNPRHTVRCLRPMWASTGSTYPEALAEEHKHATAPNLTVGAVIVSPGEYKDLDEFVTAATNTTVVITVYLGDLQ